MNPRRRYFSPKNVDFPGSAEAWHPCMLCTRALRELETSIDRHRAASNASRRSRMFFLNLSEKNTPGTDKQNFSPKIFTHPINKNTL